MRRRLADEDNALATAADGDDRERPDGGVEAAFFAWWRAFSRATMVSIGVEADAESMVS